MTIEDLQQIMVGQSVKILQWTYRGLELELPDAHRVTLMDTIEGMAVYYDGEEIFDKNFWLEDLEEEIEP